MNRIFAGLLCLLAATAAADEVRRSVEASSDGIVSISNTAGAIDVQGWSRSQVEVIADLGRGVDELIVERDGNEVNVIVKVPRNHSRGVSSDLLVRIPENSSVKIGSVSADITVQNVFGSQQLQSVSGDIDSQAFAADVDVESVSGDIALQGDRKDLRTHVSTVSGDIDVIGLSGEVDAGSVSGDIVVADGSYQRARLGTTNGDMVFHAALRDSGRMDVETINGDVNIEFDGDISARFDIESFNGDIRNCFGPKPERTSRYAPGRELVFTEGGGSGRVTIRTLNGDLELCRD